MVNSSKNFGDRLALSPAEITALTGIGRNTIYNAIASGELFAKKVGLKKLIVPVDELKRWLKENET
jgi:excisionase family DNA binding protein